MHSTPSASNCYQKYHGTNRLARMLVRHFVSTVISTLEPLNIKTVLDVGCGEGILMHALSRRYPHLAMAGIDIRPQALLNARSMNPNIDLMRGDAHHIPVRDRAYDLVLATEVLEHLHTPPKALAEMRRVSAHYCLLSVPNEPFFSALSFLKGHYVRRLGRHPEHLHAFTTRGFLQLLEGDNWSILSVRKPFPWNLVLCEVSSPHQLLNP